MKAKLLALVALATLCTGALASSFGHLSRVDDAEITHPGAISNDIYVKGFGLAEELIRFQSESGASVDSEQQAQGNAIGYEWDNARGGNAALFGAGNTTIVAGVFTGSDAATGNAMPQGAAGNVGVGIAAAVGNQACVAIRPGWNGSPRGYCACASAGKG